MADSTDAPYSWPGLANADNLSKTRLLAIVFVKATYGHPKILPENADDLTANNGKIPNRRIWTLLHELTHVYLGSRDYMRASKCCRKSVSIIVQVGQLKTVIFSTQQKLPYIKTLIQLL